MLFQKYKKGLWGMMDWLGVTRSTTRKMMAAVTIQFVAMIGLFVLPAIFLGTDVVTVFPPEQIVATTLVFVLAVIAYGNTLLIVTEDVTGPLSELQATAASISDGNIDEDPPTTDQKDEIGALIGSFEDMHEYLATIIDQTHALADEDFDAAVLDEDVPGSVGDSLERLQASLESRITELKAQREEIETQREKLEADAEHFGNVFRKCAEGDLTQRLTVRSENEAMREIGESFNEMMSNNSSKTRSNTTPRRIPGSVSPSRRVKTFG